MLPSILDEEENTLPSSLSRNTAYAVCIAAMLLLGVAVAAGAARVLGWETAAHARVRPLPPATHHSFNGRACVGRFPRPSPSFSQRGSPATVRDLAPSCTTGGGGNIWDYTLSYWDSARSGARTPLTFTEDTPTPRCPSPPCLRAGPRIGRPLPASVRRKLPYAQLFVGQSAPEIVLRWRVGRNVYTIQAHGMSLSDILRVASSLHRL